MFDPCVCPLEGSTLQPLGGRIASNQRDVSYHYYPTCDAGFLFWSNASNRPDVFIWRRQSGRLVLNAADQPRATGYAKEDWATSEQNLLDGVELYLRNLQRDTPNRCRCPNDAGIIPVVAELPLHEVPTVRFAWCTYCQELFALVNQGSNGWKACAGFAHRGSSGYVLFKTLNDSSDLASIIRRVSEVPYPPTNRTMEPQRQHAYRYLLYRAMLDIRGLAWTSIKWTDLIKPGQLQGHIHRAGKLADWFHNLALYASLNFEGFDEEMFWRQGADLDRQFPEFGSKNYRVVFEGRLGKPDT